MKQNFPNKVLAKSKQLVFVTALVSLLAASFVSSRAVSAAAPMTATRTITIQALIDGRSQLILVGRTVQWLHFDFAAPGRHLGADEPTIINGQEWFPSWPDEPNAENRDCNCYSDIFKGFKPALPNAKKMTVELKVVQGRGDVRIVDASTDSKKNLVIVEFDDNPFSGPAIYQIELTISFGGKP